MATIVTRSGKGSALTHTEMDANFTNLNTSKLENVSEDATPQLGGDLDLNSNNITGTGNIPAGNLTGALPAIDGSALSGTGKVLQVVSATYTGLKSTTSTTAVDIGVDATITTTETNSKIIILYDTPVGLKGNWDQLVHLQLRYSGNSYGSVLTEQASKDRGTSGDHNRAFGASGIKYLHSPNVASGTTLTYKEYWYIGGGASNCFMYDFGDSGSCILMEVSA